MIIELWARKQISVLVATSSGRRQKVSMSARLLRPTCIYILAANIATRNLLLIIMLFKLLS